MKHKDIYLPRHDVQFHPCSIDDCLVSALVKLLFNNYCDVTVSMGRFSCNVGVPGMPDCKAGAGGSLSGCIKLHIHDSRIFLYKKKKTFDRKTQLWHQLEKKL